MIENEMNLKIKCLKFDNEIEYIDEDLKCYYAENEIKITKIIFKNLARTMFLKR